MIRDAKFKTFGCGSAIASSSYLTEAVKGLHVSDAVKIKNTDIANDLKLPPVKLHCSSRLPPCMPHSEPTHSLTALQCSPRTQSTRPWLIS